MIHHQFFSAKSKTLTRLLTILLLAVCSLTAGTVKADIITITGVTDTVRVKGLAPDSSPFDDTQSGNQLPGNIVSVNNVFAGGVRYGSYLTSQYPSVSGPNIGGLNTDYEQFVPSQAATAPTSFIFGSAEVFFTATTSLITGYDVLAYTGADPDFPGLNRRTTFSLFDITNNNEMFSRTFGKQNGLDFDNTITAPNGSFVDGNQYRWRSSVQSDNNGLPAAARSVGGARLRLFHTTIPEPTSAAILGLAGLGMLMRRRRR